MSVATLTCLCGALLAVAAGPPAQASEPGTGPPRFVVEAVGTERAAPDLLYVLMKMEYQAGEAREATAAGEKQLRDFLAAIEALEIPALSWRVSNNVITPSDTGMRVTYTRNIVFSLPVEAGAERGPVVARIEDLGARFNSHCVTCIGSG